MTDSLQKASATLLLSADDLDPQAVTKLLGVEPTHSARKGEESRRSHGREVVAPTGMWAFDGGWRSPPSLDQQITELLFALPSDPQLWVTLTSRYRCYMTLGGYLRGWTGGLTLAPDTLGLLAARKLALDIDLYSPTASTDA